MVVKCIKSTYCENPNALTCIEGSHYTVVGTKDGTDNDAFYGSKDDTWYIFLETGDASHHYSCFMPVFFNEENKTEEHADKKRNAQSVQDAQAIG